MSSNSCPDPNSQESGVMFDQFKLEKIELKQGTSSNGNISGWLVESTALNNVEEPQKPRREKTKENIKGIAEHLFKGLNKVQDTEIVISIHGYANHTEPDGSSPAKNRYQETNDYISNSATIDKSKHIVFLGYLWPSEKPFHASGENPVRLALENAFESSPTLFRYFFKKSLNLLLFFLALSVSLSALFPTLLIKISNPSSLSKLSFFSYFVLALSFIFIFSLLFFLNTNKFSQRFINSASEIKEASCYLQIFSVYLPLIFLCSALVWLLSKNPLLLALAASSLGIYIFYLAKLFNFIQNKDIGFLAEIRKASWWKFLCIIIVATLVLVSLLVHISWILLVVLLTGIFGVITTLALLKLSNYFRDSYRATNYGVPDLVELIRQIDYFVFGMIASDYLNEHPSSFKSYLNEYEPNVRIDWLNASKEEHENIWNELKSDFIKIKNHEISQWWFKEERKKIKLNFIGHSMGCFVTTNTVRILSDVFDSRSVEKDPPSDIGHVFSLGRLVLVAPDISVLTIVPQRANFLRASLRRFDEAYIFCNEADLALRLLSPIANYFSFPTNKREQGYRLGNITASGNITNSSGTKSKKYGIVNLPLSDLSKPSNPAMLTDPFNCLEIRYPGNKTQLRDFRSSCVDGTSMSDTSTADRFTYFDCTNYKESKGIVSFAEGKEKLEILDYLLLVWQMCKGDRIDTHGGYFEGVFSQKLINDLAFFGFEKRLSKDKVLTVPVQEDILKAFSDECSEKQIKVVLTSKGKLAVNLFGKCP